MSQITIYLDEKLERKIRQRAKTAKLSVSKWIANTVEAQERDSWPADVLASFGAWNDIPDLKSIRTSYGRDARRERLD